MLAQKVFIVCWFNGFECARKNRPCLVHAFSQSFRSRILLQTKPRRRVFSYFQGRGRFLPKTPTHTLILLHFPTSSLTFSAVHCLSSFTTDNTIRAYGPTCSFQRSNFFKPNLDHNSLLKTNSPLLLPSARRRSWFSVGSWMADID